MSDRIEKLSWAERWFRDGLRAIDPPGALLAVEVDMSRPAALRSEKRLVGVSVTYTQIVIVAIAAALQQLPELHRMVAGNKRLTSDTIDICLSVAGENVVTPVVILKDAERRTLELIGQEIKEKTAVARASDQKLTAFLNKWGWVVPAAFARRALIRFLLSRTSYRRTVSGTFQLTALGTVDQIAPFLFNTAAAVGMGEVRDRVIAVDGRPEVRPTAVLTCCCDHKVWNGMDAARFLNAVKAELESMRTHE
ncbi:MAG TPA: 2-oxo acid dehydrogenase subunit E2 [Bryobacteraceae bacterium]|jgi:pyruvate/2-oxoglutarate dehydrogenase complex dihydrolipoamide acyltransferase (E2) component